jgi:hypothetical protein
MSSKIEMSYEKYRVIYWANLSRFNNLMIILNISMFFLSGWFRGNTTIRFTPWAAISLWPFWPLFRCR